jgi:hypothetical protein
VVDKEDGVEPLLGSGAMVFVDKLILGDHQAREKSQSDVPFDQGRRVGDIEGK